MNVYYLDKHWKLSDRNNSSIYSVVQGINQKKNRQLLQQCSFPSFFGWYLDQPKNTLDSFFTNVKKIKLHYVLRHLDAIIHFFKRFELTKTYENIPNYWWLDDEKLCTYLYILKYEKYIKKTPLPLLKFE